MPDNFIFTDFGAIPDFASELSRLSAVFGDRIKKLINFEPGNENSIRISLLNYDFEVNLTQLYSRIQLFSDIVEIESKYLPPGLDRISAAISDMMLELSGDICRPTNSVLT